MDFKILAKQYGYTDQEIEEFLRIMPEAAKSPTSVIRSGILERPQPYTPPKQSLFDIAKSAGYSDQEIKQVKQVMIQIPQSAEGDVVSPFSTDKSMTQEFDNFNPGMGYHNNLHKGQDFGGQMGEEIKTPIGGQVMENKYDPDYGWTVTIQGQNPQEFVQSNTVDPQNDAVKLSHLAQKAPWNVGDYIATGSGGLKMGSTGNSTGVHTDIESFPIGSPQDFEKKRAFTQFYNLIKERMK